MPLSIVCHILFAEFYNFFPKAVDKVGPGPGRRIDIRQNRVEPQKIARKGFLTVSGTV